MKSILKKILNKAPFLRCLIKYLCDFVLSFVYKKTYVFSSVGSVECLSKNSQAESFFGYYDKSPYNTDGNYCIYQESTKYKTSKKPTEKISIDVILWDNISNVCKARFQTSAYNWQQGAKLMWVDNEHFGFNDYCSERKKFYWRKINAVTLQEDKINSSVYDVFGDYALTIDYNKIRYLRPDYCYRNMNFKPNLYDIENDGVFYIDILKNKKKLLISIKELIQAHYKETMKGAKHWVNHIMINPNGTKFMFLHRWLLGNVKYDAMFVYDFSTTKLLCLVDDGMVSHSYWQGNDTIISYMRDAKYGDKYYKIDLETGRREIIGEGVIDNLGDGHPSILGNKMLFDTYPNEYRMKTLYLYDFLLNSCKKLGEFYEPLSFRDETRCDLHPRFITENKICFDSTHTKKRGVYVMNV